LNQSFAAAGTHALPSRLSFAVATFSAGDVMALTDEMGEQGLWLFRWRSYLPTALLVLLFPASLLGLRWPFGSYEFHMRWEFACFTLSFLGLAIRCATVGCVPGGTSGRGTRDQIAKVLNTTGWYSVLRHPLYFGNYLIGLGVTLVWFDWWAPVIYTLFFWLYYERIMFAEELFLEAKFGDDFRKWAASTPAFFPRFSRWRSSELPFSMKTVLRREYSGLLLLVILHSGMEVIEHIWLDRQLRLGPYWTFTLIAAIGIYITLSVMKKHSRLLVVRGR
jgi:protein-S-isoprenylcysteine O-methyltransferase Ste14